MYIYISRRLEHIEKNSQIKIKEKNIKQTCLKEIWKRAKNKKVNNKKKKKK